MTYTRRSFLRDTSMVSLATALETRSLLAQGAPPQFACGVRVFFAGSWIFCGVPNEPQNMMAVAFDPSKSEHHPSDNDVPHIFPYGIWDESVTNGSDWNDTQEKDGMKLPFSTRKKPHMITVPNWTSTVKCVNQLFCDANTASRFIYMPSKRGRKIPDAHWKSHGLIVIKLPIPTRIIPAAFMKNATLCDPAPVMQCCHHKRDQGVATTHIFEYQNASCIHFALAHHLFPTGCENHHCPKPINASASTKSHSNLHFHTVPYPKTKKDEDGEDVKIVPIEHQRTMFHHLVRFLDEDACQAIALNACMDDVFTRGDLVPSSVSCAELQISDMDPHKHAPGTSTKVNLATCDSGGLGMSCPPDGC